MITGAVLGLLIPQVSTLPFASGVVNVVGTVKYILGQIITFCVPLIIIGFIAPSFSKGGDCVKIIYSRGDHASAVRQVPAWAASCRRWTA